MNKKCDGYDPLPRVDHDDLHRRTNLLVQRANYCKLQAHALRDIGI